MEHILGQFHPIFVHFPIGLLTVYAILELVPIKRLWTDPRWIFAKRLLLFFGTAGLIVSVMSGEGRVDSAGSTNVALRYHEQFAEITQSIFVTLALTQVILILNQSITSLVKKNAWVDAVWKILEKIALFLSSRPVLVVGSAVGLVCLLITGALGGGMVYGADADQFVSIVYKMFGIK